MTIETDLNVEILYETEDELIVLKFTQGERLISIGLSIHEAQAFNIHLTEIIGAAIVAKLGLTPPPKETRH